MKKYKIKKVKGWPDINNRYHWYYPYRIDKLFSLLWFIPLFYYPLSIDGTHVTFSTKKKAKQFIKEQK